MSLVEGPQPYLTTCTRLYAAAQSRMMPTNWKPGAPESSNWCIQSNK